MRIVAILLAAGSSRRFGDEKLLAAYKGRALFEHSLDALADSPFIDEIVVVIRPRFPVPSGRQRCRFVVNPDHEEGMGSSLRAGVRATPEGVAAYVIALADMPDIKPELIASLIACYRSAGKTIVVPVYRGRRGHPVVIGGELRDMLLQTTGDVGARAIIRDHPERVGHFETDNEAVVFDVDVPEDLAGR
jgi:molybdenum cofactor cytidylyltransferase